MERSTPEKVLREHIDLAGKRVADIGCGDGWLSRFMAESGAQVTGIDVNAKSLEKAKSAPPVAGETFMLGSAEELPFEDAALDVVVFHNSLHHVPGDRLAAVLAEAARVLKPGGVLYVSEPMAEGPRWELARAVNDESTARDRAYAAIKAAGAQGLEAADEFTYLHERSFADFEDFHRSQIERSERRKKVFAEREAEVRALFERLAVRRDGRCWFDQPIRINILRKAA